MMRVIRSFNINLLYSAGPIKVILPALSEMLGIHTYMRGGFIISQVAYSSIEGADFDHDDFEFCRVVPGGGRSGPELDGSWRHLGEIDVDEHIWSLVFWRRVLPVEPGKIDANMVACDYRDLVEIFDEWDRVFKD